ncbi:penicillin-binding transpeptidase domain-containing protein [Nocardiopsis ganjiahuensis]|uniref:penicillin-binding transpeptidase domain-containing protein n=1 Tax=Nocardiopsis ganjiahuensis TaxID=239984 RepID=UPI000348A524|nr:penicillin-binding transpeptidase domain-containing protein [Nocardiopsis ganjiahuensis]
MDERSPRQPDSSGPPEDSDGTEARQPRPENPYRIPQRPPGARPAETGGLGFEPSGPVRQEGAVEPAPPADRPDEAAEPWGTPYRGSHQAPAPEPGAEPASWNEPEPEQASWAAPEAEQPSWNAPDADRSSWNEPEAEQPSWNEPEAEQPSWNAPDTVNEPWQEPRTSRDQPEQQWGQPAQNPDQGWPAPEEPSAERPPEPSQAWNSPDTVAQSSWGRPVEPPTDEPHEPWGTPVAPRPAQADRNGPAGQQAPQESWDDPGTGAQEGWAAQAAQGYDGPGHDSSGYDSQGYGTPGYETPGYASPGYDHSDHSGYGSQGNESQGHEAHRPEGAAVSPEAWETPYAGQPAYQGDTPYPGSAPEPSAHHDPQEEGRSRSDSYEFLYSGQGGYGGPEGPGGHTGPGGPGGPGGPQGPDDPYDDDAYDPGPPPPRKKSRRGLIIGVVASVVVLALLGGAAGWYVYTLPQPEEATAEYEAAWEDQDFARLAAVTTGDDAEEILGGIDAGLGVDGVEVEIGTPTTEGSTGSAPYEVTVALTNADDWGWEGELPLVREDGEWWVDFSPEVAYPGLGEGQVLARTAVWGERGQIQAADGTQLDTPELSGSLQMIVGELGEADEDDVERLGPAYSVGDTVGKTGLQRTYEERLAGEAATTIVMVDAAEAEELDSLEVTEENTVTTLDGSDGESVTTSIDMTVQNAAANAVIDSDKDTGMVAIRPSTGEILAAVNVPGGFNRAFEGQYPPGSSFKIVTYSSLLDNGLSVDATMDCPKEYDLGGWPFRNAGEAEYGEQTVTEAFATSCNTALAHEIGQHLSPENLQASAEQFGMNAPLDIGVNTHEPSFPPVDSATMMGAQGIGQGQILTSPLHMATVPAAVADGSWRHPVLVTEPAREDLPEPNPIGNAEALRPMMRAVITEGTAKDAGFQGEVYGKTGSAEFGTADDADEDGELPSHAWMVGYKGDVAFAVVVDGGGGGGSVAGPLGAKFTNAL